MAFGSFVLTNFGQSQLVKAHKGKIVHFSRMALGDGDIGTSSVFDVTQLKSEKLSLLIDAVSITEQEALVTVLLSNALVDTGFNLREMGLMAVDPDTSQEAVYCYNRDSSAGEYIPDKNSSSTLREYLRVHCNVEGVQNITFSPSGNPLFVTPEELKTEVSNQISTQKGAANGLAELDANGKLKQMPTIVDIGAAAAADLTAHTGNAVAHVTQADHDKINGAVPNTRKINSKALSADVTLTPTDIGAIPDTASCNKAWNWSGQSGQPSWLWGGNDASNMYVYNPSNFNVNGATYSTHAVGSGGAALRNNTATVGGGPSGGSDGDGWDICT